MCTTCGCDTKGGVQFYSPSNIQKGELSMGMEDLHHHHHHHHKETVQLEEDILSSNNLIAEENRRFFKENDILTFNLVSSPGSGKTSLLERTLTDLKEKHKFYVIEGDQQTMQDADRIHATGISVIQINTGQGCHLNSDMVAKAINELKVEKNSIIFIENVGNLVCPAMFDLGEKKRVVIISVTEGEDKPLKYPDMFASSDICVINKTDLLPYVNFSVEKAKEYALRVNSKLKFVCVSATTGAGMEDWYEVISQLIE